MQAANRVSKGITKKTAGLAIGGSCLATGVISGILGIRFAQSFDLDIAKFVAHDSENKNRLKFLGQNMQLLSLGNYKNRGSLVKIFSKKNQDMIRGYKEILDGAFGLNAYFINSYLNRVCRSAFDMDIDDIKKDSNLTDQQKEKQIKSKNDERSHFKDKTKTLSEICKLYEACISKLSKEELTKLENESSIDDALIQKISSDDFPIKELSKVLDKYFPTKNAT